MRALLDTHAVLWALSDDPRLSNTAREIIESLENDIIVSAVSAWEIAVKVSLGKLQAPEDLDGVPIITRDEDIARYPVSVIW